MPLGGKSAVIAIFKTVKSNIYQIFIEQQVLALIISKNDHKRFNK